MLCFCVSNRNCRPRCACFRAALEAKSLRPARTLGTDYTPVYLIERHYYLQNIEAAASAPVPLVVSQRAQLKFN